jgi:hypothetical protein
MTTMLTTQDAKAFRDLIDLNYTPYRMAPYLVKLMDAQIDTLIKLGGMDIGYGLGESLKLYYETKSMDHLARNWQNHVSSTLPNYEIRAIVRRLALTKLFKRATKKCFSKLASAEAAEYSRMYKCPALGTCKTTWPCRSMFCPNCRMRLANKTYQEFKKKLAERDIKTLHANVVEVDVPFTERRYGYTPVIDEILLQKIIRRLKKFNYLGCKTLGASVIDKVPYVSFRIAIISADDKAEEINSQLIKFKKYLRKHEPQKRVSIHAVEGLDNVCVELYDASPIYLLGLTPEGFSSSILQHTVEEFRTAVRSKKKVLFFGTGVK